MVVLRAGRRHRTAGRRDPLRSGHGLGSGRALAAGGPVADLDRAAAEPAPAVVAAATIPCAALRAVGTGDVLRTVPAGAHPAAG
ncbi:hypothetical protein [Saccharopolyspora mangrovi]|uniref:Uncharacterized protein n=1 Tax=Saccharopolyspora mangrovi TaxID=3082379 RepID=A0ABU6AKS6_9PSEU|nr:hypothetical protein [Saccharopolyspora sp. S2-29]MEB3372169.1 hypothetical protein [Saccharopolyspora sp. S2-29]